MTQSPLYFKQLQLGPMQNFTYLIGDPATREAAVVDPGWEAAKILEAVARDGYRLSAAIATHYHYDHVNALGDILKAVDIPVYAHEEDAPSIKISRTSLKPMRDGDTITIGKMPVSLVHTPGHTPGSQCIVVEGRLMSGDTLFIGAVGRTDLLGGSSKELFHSLNTKIKPMDDATIVCPGHDYGDTPTASLGDEKRHNPFLAAATVQDFLRLTGS